MTAYSPGMVTFMSAFFSRNLRHQHADYREGYSFAMDSFLKSVFDIPHRKVLFSPSNQ